MAAKKPVCYDCNEFKHECVCDEQCDHCTSLGLSHCCCDKDPYGNTIRDHKEWQREMEDSVGDHEYRRG